MRRFWLLWLVVHAVVLWRGVAEQSDVLDVACRGCPSVFRLSPADRKVLRDSGVSMAGYRWFVAIVVVAFAIGSWAVAWALVYRARRGLWPVVAGYLLVSLGAVRWIEEGPLRSIGGVVGVAAMVAMVVNYVAPVALFALFPDGRWVPRWSRWAVGGVFVWAMMLAVTPLGEDLATGRDPATLIDATVFLASLVTIVGWQVARFRSGNAVVRAQCRWVLASLLLALTMFVPVVVVTNLEVGVALAGRLVSLGAVVFALFVVVLALAAALVRHGLWNLDVVVNRMLVYGGLTALLVAGYAAAVLLASGPLGGRGTWAVVVSVTVVAGALEPLRRRLQVGVDRLVYGARDVELTPVAAPFAADPRAALDRTAAGIAAQTRLAGVAIEVLLADCTALVGTSGDLGDGATLEVPLVVDDEVVGSLRAATRRGQGRFTRADVAMLDRLVAQLSATAAIVRLIHSSHRAQSAARAVNARGEPEVPDWMHLSDRERILLGRLAGGRTNDEIASELGISQKTVRNQLSLLYAKLAVVDRSQAALAARDLGFG